MQRERLDSFCERGILLLTLAVLVFGPLATGAVRTQDFLVIQALTIGATLLWIFRLWLDPRPQLLWPPVCWPVLVFAFYGVARYFTTEVEYPARLELSRLIVYALLFFIVLNNLHRQESVRIVTFTLVFLAMGISFYAVGQFITHSNRVWNFISPYPGRAGGTYICPNHLAGFLEMILPLALAHAIASRLKIPVKIILGYAALVMVAGIAVTISRGGWLACAASVLLFCSVMFLRRSFRWASVAVLGLLVAAAIFAARSPAVWLRVERTFFPNDENVTMDNIRFELWKPAVRMWLDHPWFGVGPAQFDERFRIYRPMLVQMKPEHVHNDYLETFADWGALGAAMAAVTAVLLALGVLKTWKFVRGPARDLGGNQSDKFAFVCGAALGLFALLLHSAVDFNLHIPANAILAATLAALLSSHLRFATESYWVTAKTWLKAAVIFMLLASVIFLGAQGWCRAQEFFALQRAALAQEFSPAQIELLKKAFAVEPENFETAYAIGEAYRLRSMDGNWNYAELGQSALEWFTRAEKLNPFAAECLVRHGMCLDWLERHDEAAKFFTKAEALDPNGAFTASHIGWHYMQTGDYAAARTWCERSLRLDDHENLIAEKYLEIANRRLREAAAKPEK